MKKIISLITAFLVLSCSSDNPDSQVNNTTLNPNTNNGPVPVYSIKLPKKITLTSSPNSSFSREYNFTYDNRNRLIKTIVSGALNVVYEYSYNEFQLTTITVNGTNTFTILYESSGRLSGVINNGITTPITYDSGTELYTYGSHTFSIKEKDIKKFDNDIFQLLQPPFWGPFYSVLGYNTFAAILTDEKMLNFATRRPCANLFHPVTHESKSMAFSIYGGEYFEFGSAYFANDNSYLQLYCIYINAYQYENIPRL